MTNSKKKGSLREGLSSALRPPKQRDKNISSLLDRFSDDDVSVSPEDSISPQSNPTQGDRLSAENNLLQMPPLGYQESNLSPAVNLTPADSPSDLWASIPVVKGHTRFWHMIIDHLYQNLDSFEQAAYTQLYRLSWGYGKDTCNISNRRLAERANLKLTTARHAIKGLERKGLVQKIGYTWGKNHEQGIHYRLPLPDSLARTVKQSPDDNLSPDAPIKEINTQKETTQTQVSVGVSRFSLEECRRYADHLKSTGQGITNPGGYSTKIFRSGEADALIESFLNPQPVRSSANCALCGGSGFIYLDEADRDKGVRPCRHEAK